MYEATFRNNWRLLSSQIWNFIALLKILLRSRCLKKRQNVTQSTWERKLNRTEPRRRRILKAFTTTSCSRTLNEMHFGSLMFHNCRKSYNWTIILFWDISFRQNGTFLTLLMTNKYTTPDPFQIGLFILSSISTLKHLKTPTKSENKTINCGRLARALDLEANTRKGRANKVWGFSITFV